MGGGTAVGGASSIALAPEPRAAKAAREWVSEACVEIGRAELVECARLAVSEVVTNAVLHAEPPLELSRGGGPTRPYFKVSDGSTAPPRPNPAMTHEELLLSTIGRGLGLVASCSAAWGAQIHDQGKVVWFQPLAEPREHVDFTSALIEYDVEQPPQEDQVDIVLESVPVPAYREFLRHHGGLAREVRLIVLTDPEADPVIQETARQCAAYARASVIYRDPAMLDLPTSDQDQVDVELRVSARSIEVARALHAALGRLDALLDQGALDGTDLLVEQTTPDQRAFRDWFFGELTGRGDRRLAERSESAGAQP